MATRLKMLLLMSVLFFSFIPALAQDKGSDNISIKGGALGNVSFPHLKHQEILPDCDTCHNLFPQTAGSIETQMRIGKIKGKDVMIQCQNCHRQRMALGQKSGPTDCKGCHQK